MPPPGNCFAKSRGSGLSALKPTSKSSAGITLPSGPTGGRANLSDKLGRGGGVNGIDGPTGKGLTIPPRSINVGP